MDEFEKQLSTLAANNQMKYDAVICPPMPSVMFVGNRLLDRVKHAHTYLGVQDISPYPPGSYTGAVSGQNLQGFGVKYAILGHSERRNYFKETSLDVAKKVENCLEAMITPIVCVDKIEVEHQASLIESYNYKKLIVAYEPAEHIGTGIPENVNEVLEVVEKVKKAFPGAKVIYGASLDPQNIATYSSRNEIEGFLVGGSSLDPHKFSELLVL